jgi:hypothetical protein
MDNDRAKFNEIHKTDYDSIEFDIIRQHNFRDVFVSLNGTNLGFSQLPCTIPLLPDYSKKNNIRIIPCVRFSYSNASLTTIQYSFVEPVEQFFEMEREKEYRFSDLFSDFKLKYLDSVSFPLLETFEQGTRFSSIDTIHGAPIEIYRENGKSMGRIVIKDSLKYFKIATDFLILRGQGAKHFWEISYKCDQDITTFLHFQKASTIITQDMIGLYKTNGDFKKAYIDLTDIVTQVAGTDKMVSVRLCISGIRNSDSATANFYFENVKLISMRAPY